MGEGGADSATREPNRIDGAKTIGDETKTGDQSAWLVIVGGEDFDMVDPDADLAIADGKFHILPVSDVRAQG